MTVSVVILMTETRYDVSTEPMLSGIFLSKKSSVGFVKDSESKIKLWEPTATAPGKLLSCSLAITTFST